MQTLYALRNKSPLEVGAQPGTTINKASEEAIKLSKYLDIVVILHFNGRKIYCDYRVATADDIASVYISTKAE